MANIIDVKTLNLRTKFQIVKVEMDCVDPYFEGDFRYVESMVDTHSVYTGFRYITGLRSKPDGTYFTYW